jgi:hypothetical protein
MGDDGAITAIVARRSEHAGDRITVSGTVHNGNGGWFIVSINRLAIAAVVMSRERAWRIRGNGGSAELTNLAWKPFPCTIYDHPNDPSSTRRASGSCEDEPEIDVLVVYTSEAAASIGGHAVMAAELDLMIEYHNVSHADSLIDAQLRLAYARQITPESTSVPLPQLIDPSDGVMDGVHALREAYAADQVALMLPGWFGVANGLWNLDAESEATAFCVCGIDASPIVLPHEIGHNLGCCHPAGSGGGCPLEGGLLYPYSNAHGFTGISGTFHGTVMAGGMLQRFSDPELPFDGQPTGIPEGQDGHPGAENARTIRQSAMTVANWRCSNDICRNLDLPYNAMDCDDDMVPDACEIALDAALDINMNGALDSCEGLGDANNDGFVDLNDYAVFHSCHGGPLVNVGSECSPFDIDIDLNVDLADLAGFMRLLTN